MTHPTNKTTRPGCSRNGSESNTEETNPMSVTQATALLQRTATPGADAPTATPPVTALQPCLPGCTEDHEAKRADWLDRVQECHVHEHIGTVPTTLRGCELSIDAIAATEGLVRYPEVLIQDLPDEDLIQITSAQARAMAARLIAAADRAEELAGPSVPLGVVVTDVRSESPTCPDWCALPRDHAFVASGNGTTWTRTHRQVIFTDPNHGVFEQQDAVVDGRLTRDPVTFSLRGAVVAVGEAEMGAFLKRFAELCADLAKADVR